MIFLEVAGIKKVVVKISLPVANLQLAVLKKVILIVYNK